MLSLRVFLSLIVIFSIHRTLSYSYLVPNLHDSNLLKETLVGFWSDLWISFLLAIPFLLSKPQNRIIRRVAFGWVFIWLSMTVAHQTYVEYFRFQIIPFHLSYMFDTSFLAANSKSNFTGNSLYILIGGFFVSGLFFLINENRNHLIDSKSKKFLYFVLIVLVFVAIHAANIKWRVQWFVPENLQSNYVERLFINIKSKKTPKILENAEVIELASINHQEPSLPIHELLKSNLEYKSSYLDLIRSSLESIKKSQRSPLVILFIAESFRPADSGWTRDQNDLSSITPSFDSLIKSGVLFENAYSSGPVTRGGQESMWCGTPSATDSSLMRSFPMYPIDCIPDILNKNSTGMSVWAHGGDEKFDSQLSFWKSHGVNEFILKSNFDSDTPSTGWGIGDMALVEKVSSNFTPLAKQNAGKVINLQVLSVTNHIPWDLPKDSTDDIRSLKVTHPSQKTIAYFDLALGKLVSSLKSKNLWQDTLLIVASDHGNLEKSRNESYKLKSTYRYEELLSHINLVLSGGVIEYLVSRKQLPRLRTEFVSQIQIAPFISYVSQNSKNLFFDVPLFSPSMWPVASDLNQYLYLPKSNIRIEKERAILGVPQEVDNESHLATLRYRAYLQSLYQSKI